MEASLNDPINASIDKEIFLNKKKKYYTGVMDLTFEGINPLNRKPFSLQYKYTAITGKKTSVSERLISDVEKEINEFKDMKRRNPENKDGGWPYMKTFLLRTQFFSAFLKGQVIIIRAGTGVGKTVVIPKLGIHAFGYKKKILIGIPTRKAVESAASYATTTFDSKLGEEVGLAMGGDKKYSGKSKIIYCTIGWLEQYITGNPELEGVGAIFLDEVHIRDVSIDTTMAMIANIISTTRPDLKLVLISATIEPPLYVKHFKSIGLKPSVFEIEGDKGIFNIDSKFYPRETKIQEIEDKLLIPEIDRLLRSNEKGHILVFITAGGKGRKLGKTIRNMIDKDKKSYPLNPWITVLEGVTNEEIVKYATADGKNYRELDGGIYNRMLIFATNTVEASITFEIDKEGVGLVWVIDTGLKWQVRFDSDKYATVMGPEFTAQSNMLQRIGRTGRKNDGIAIRLYSEPQKNNLPYQGILDIESSDITSTLIKVLSLPSIQHYSRALEFFKNMLTPPPRSSIQVAALNLINNKLMYPPGEDKRGELSGMARICVAFGKYGVNVGRMIIAGYYFGCLASCINLAAIISAGRKGFNTFFNISDDKDLKKEQIRETEKFNHPFGEHFTILNMYKRSRNDIIYEEKEGEPSINLKEKKRKEWAFKNNVNYKILEEIDNAVRDLYDTTREKIIEIKLGNFFNIKGFTKQKEFIDGLAKRKYDIRGLIGGGNTVNQDHVAFNNPSTQIFHGHGDKSILSEYFGIQDGGKKKKKKPLLSQAQQPIIEGEKPIIEGEKPIIEGEKPIIEGQQPKVEGQQAKKKFTNKKKNKGKVAEKDRVLGNNEHYLKRHIKKTNKKGTQTKILADKLDEYQKLKKLNEEAKREEEKLKEMSVRISKEAGVKTPKDKAVAILDVITLLDMNESNEITRFTKPDNNIMACLFYGFHTKLAAHIKDKSGHSRSYAVKNINPVKPYTVAEIKDTIFDRMNERPTLLIYNDCTIMNNSGSLSLVSKIHPRIILKFLPQLL
jgi:HrpA-like RNA helicase